eukprot:10466691-Alexandrium_andersonii.AAC.1
MVRGGVGKRAERAQLQKYRMRLEKPRAAAMGGRELMEPRRGGITGSATPRALAVVGVVCVCVCVCASVVGRLRFGG